MKKPVLLAALFLVFVSGIISIAGGALGDSFGLGFLGSPIPEISVPGEKIVDIGGYELINSFILFWAAILIIIVVSYLGTRNMKMVPTGFQNFVEFLVEGFISLVEGVGGSAARRFLPLVMTIFLVIIVGNWLGDLPGVGTIGRIEKAQEIIDDEIEDVQSDVEKETAGLQLSDAEFQLRLIDRALEEQGNKELAVFDGSGNFNFIPFGRSNDTKTDLDNVLKGIPDGLAPDEKLRQTDLRLEESKIAVPPPDDDGNPQTELVGKDTGILIPYLRGPNTDLNATLGIALIAMFAIQWWGFRALGIRGYGSKFINLKNGPIHFAVGLLEIVSEMSRIISFTFRLFGNMFAGEILLVAMGFLFPIIGIIPFLGLELFVGAIQAFIFAMLTLVFAVVATASHGEQDH